LGDFVEVMMAPVLNLPAGFALVTYVWTGSAVPTGAVSTFGIAVPAGETNPNTTATGIGSDTTTLGTGWFPSGNAWPTSLTLARVVVKFGPLDTGPTGEATINVTGGAAGDAYAPNAALMVTKSTALGGRRGKGRMFLPPLTENGIQAFGVIDPAQVATIQGRLNTWRDALVADGRVPHLLHRHDPALGQTPVPPTPITTFTLQGTVFTQRRRLHR
jgi:hypothetical protein